MDAQYNRDWCKARFLHLWERIGADYRIDGERLFEQLAVRYEEPHRRYHTLEHIRCCLETFDKYRRLTKFPGSVQIALFYHDVIYDAVPNARNEERSVEFSELFFYKWRYGAAENAWKFNQRLILATKHDRVVTDPDEQLMVDIDLAALGAPWEQFLLNNLQVRNEYAHVPEKDFRKGNGEILQRFLDRTPLYYHPEIEADLGAQAKENLTRWLNRP